MAEEIVCRCGNKVELVDAFTNTCPDCGQEFNGFGQALAPRCVWGEETGESLADIFSTYDEEEVI